MSEKKVVNLAVEPTPPVMSTPQVVEPQVVEPQPVAPATETPVTPIPVEPAPTPAVLPAQADVDEFGVPWKNRAMEWKRKSEEVIDRLPQMIEEKLQKVSQPQTPVYSFEQLEAYKLQNATDPNAVAWATGEQRKMQTAENKRLFEEVVGARERTRTEETLKEKSLKYVQKEYPEAFKKDASGNPVAWDESHPITQGIFNLMRNPMMASNPEGLSAAADIAYGRFAKTQTPALQQQVVQAKADIKQAQKASLTEGGGRKAPITATPQQTAIARARETGTLKDAESAMGAVLRAKGILTD